jgi:phage baseplate assembly protein W
VQPILAHPFRVVGNAVVTVDPASDDGQAQLLAVLLTTRKGERQLQPAFGVPDPVFSTYDVSAVNAGLAMFGPDVQVTDIEVTQQSETVEAVQVNYLPRGRS